MAFADIVGNTRVKTILGMALRRGRVPQSLLFTGPAGVGKTAAAITLAKALNCLELREDSCDRCASCRAIDAEADAVLGDKPEKSGVAPDVMIVTRERKDVRIEQIQLLRRMACLRPMIARVRVFIVCEADRMNEESANAVLKTLEEPPSAHLILLTENSGVLLPTIVSRCQTLSFAPVGRDEIAAALRERGCPEDRARALAVLVDGNLEEALGTDWDDLLGRRTEAWALFLGLVGRDAASAFLDRFAFGYDQASGEMLRLTLEAFQSYLRDLLLLESGGDPGGLINPDFEAGLRDVAARLTPGMTLDGLDRVGAALSGLGRNFNRPLLTSRLFTAFEGWRHV